MDIDVIFTFSILLAGMALLAFSSSKAVEHSVGIASALGISPLMTGLLIVSLGTDLPEIANSITSSALGHGDINVGDSFGSVLTQMTLMLGILALVGGTRRIKRDEITVIGACMVLTFIASISMVEKGYISRMNAVFLVVSWPILMLIVKKVMKKELIVMHTDPVVAHTERKLLYHFAITVLGYTGVAVGSFIVINSVIALSAALHISEYLISFFLVAIGTSLPELVVELTCVRKKQWEIAIGDAIGSSIIDTGFTIGVGALFFPITVSGWLAETTGLYALLVSVIVLLTLALREKLDRKAGVLFIVLYMLSYTTLFVT